MKRITAVPLSELRDKFGEPGTGFISVPLPFSLRTSWNGGEVKTFYGHKYIAEVVIDALEEIADFYQGIENMRKYDLDRYGGCVMDRKAKGADRKSVHAWGLAIDLVPQLGPFGEPPQVPAPFVEAFERRGFQWGGRWRYWDGMHFSAIIEA